MATTTTNFGWDIPQSTDLVKDGATAIATLGQDIDTAFVDLKGGTTGQVLSKATGTDLDFSWVTAAGGGALTLVSPSSIAFSGTSASTTAGKTIFSACTSLSLNGVFTSTYENYIVIFSDLIMSANNVMTFLRYRASGTDTTSGYSTVAGYQNAGGTLQGNPDVNDKHNCFQVDGTRSVARLEIQNPQTATATTQLNEFMTSNYGYMKGRQTSTTQFDGFTIFNASLNFTGTVRVYGYQN
jgi:hypothetical protein